MELQVNGKPVTLEGEPTIEEFIHRYGLKTEQVVIELNRDVPEKKDYSSLRLKAGDQLEIIKFMGGG